MVDPKLSAGVTVSKEQLEAEFRSEMRASIKDLRDDVKTLLASRSWLLGACAAIGGAVSYAVAIYFR